MDQPLNLTWVYAEYLDKSLYKYLYTLFTYAYEQSWISTLNIYLRTLNIYLTCVLEHP